ncbi:uncharacterized protein LOC141952260 isoform X1 [Strix uralensis]|uniref:uncharacterized protein LOC141952260 isoform X1 n=1 Tax=Strix uralensis TaxID=36305 RepID=UPI003DA6D95F
MSPCPQARGDPGDPAGMGISPRPRPVPSGPDHGACCQPRPQAAPRGHPSRVGTGEAGLAGPTPRTPRPRVAAGPGGGARSVGRSGHGRDRARGAERVPGEIGVRRGLRRTAGSRRGTPPGGGMEGDDVLPVAGGPISQFPMDVSLLRMLQLALCSPEAPFKAELHGEAGDKRSDKSCGNGKADGEVPQSLPPLPCAFLAPSSSLRPPFVAVLMRVSHSACHRAGSSLRPCNLELAPRGGIALHTYSSLISGEPLALCPQLNPLKLAKNCREGTGWVDNVVKPCFPRVT